MRDFIEKILIQAVKDNNKLNIDVLKKSPLIRYLDLKTGAVNGNTKSRRSLANIYAIYSILYFYKDEYYNKIEKYRKFEGFEYTKLFGFYRSLYGGSKLQNHALNSRVNGEFNNKIVGQNDNKLIIINDGKYLLHIEYLYINGIDISNIAIEIIEEYIEILVKKDHSLIKKLEMLISINDIDVKKEKIKELIDEDAEARIFEIISYAILKNHYKSTKIYIGYSLDNLKEEYLTLYKTGRTNANDGGIDFVMRPLGRFYQVTEVGNYDKYLLDMDKILHFPLTFIIKTKKTKVLVEKELKMYIEEKSKGMEVIKKRYYKSIEEIITINELKKWLDELNADELNLLIRDIDLYYKMELNIEIG